MSVGRGVARIEPETSATLMGYPAKAGQVASDGVAGQANSPFATALIGNSQKPFVYGSLGGDDYFLRKP